MGPIAEPNSGSSIPNLLSGFRLLASPAMLFLAWIDQPVGFMILLATALSTDALDGYLARRLNWQSELGAKLDSWGDFTTYLTVALGAWWLWPDIIRREAVYVALAIGAYLLPIAIGFVKFRRLTSYHTWAAKLSAVVMSISALLLFSTDIAWPFRCVAVFQVLEAAEEVGITFIMPRWESNIPTIWHARKRITAQNTAAEAVPDKDSEPLDEQ